MALIIHMPLRVPVQSGQEFVLDAVEHEMDGLVETLEDEVREARTSGEALAIGRRINYMVLQLNEVRDYASQQEAVLCGQRRES